MAVLAGALAGDGLAQPVEQPATAAAVELQLRPEGINCQLKSPPAGAGESPHHGITLKVFPRRKDITASYTGCQILWAPYEGEWKEVSVTAIEDGYAVRLWSGHSADQEPFRCRYIGGMMVRGDLLRCPDPESLIVRSMAPGCVEKIREQGKAADGCHFE